MADSRIPFAGGRPEEEKPQVPTVVRPESQERPAEQPSNHRPAKPKRRPARPKKVNGVTPAVVEKILELSPKISGLRPNVRTLIEDLLSVGHGDDAKLISAIVNSNSSTKAQESIGRIKELAGLDDLKFGIQVSSMSHGDRKGMWELESKADPEKARELLNGGQFPSNSVLEEAELLRRLQKESESLDRTLDVVRSILTD